MAHEQCDLSPGPPPGGDSRQARRGADELPLRDAGYLLPSWEELSELSQACRDRGVPLHLDGARLWESQPHLGAGLAEIAALSETVYVSFYKGLGGLAGAAVAGPVEVVSAARQWRRASAARSAR